MTIKIISILLTFFIFVVVNQAGVDDVKSMKNTAIRETVIKTDGNGVSVQKRLESIKEPGAPLKKPKARLPSTISYSGTNHGTVTRSNTKPRVNFLKVLKETTKLQWTDSLHKAVSSYDFFQDPWRDRLLRSREVNKPHSSDSNFGQSVPNGSPDPDGDKYFEQGKIQSALKLLQSKREEIFDEVFVELRFSLDSKHTHMLPEIRIYPSFEKRAGFTIAF